MSALPDIEIAEVGALTLEGSGVLVPGGKRVLVPGALAGEEVTFQRRRRRRNYDEGVLVEIRRPSPDRVLPACEYFGRCGGCSLQHLSPAAQLGMKQATLLESLARIADLRPAEILPPLRGAVWGYRRKARLAVRHVERKGRVLVGFRELEKPWVVDMLSCATAEPAISRLIEPLSRLIGTLSIRARLPQVEATVADNATALVLRVLDTPSSADRDQLLEFSESQAVRIYLQPGAPESAVALNPDMPLDDLQYGLPAFDIALTFGPTDFIQVHGEVNRQMVDQALRLLAPTTADRVLDLYCGIGNFTLPLARRAGEVLGLEGASAAVRRGRHNATLAGLSSARFVEADLSGAGTEGAWTREQFDLVLLDPPRTGAAELLPALGKLAARRIVYVSCHPGTLARDAGVLVREHGYRLQSAGVMDMFPHTSHVESMALFERPLMVMVEAPVDLVISLTRQTLQVRRAGHIEREVLVSTSRYGPGEQRGSLCTPRGLHVIRAKIGRGLPVGAVLRARRPTGEVFSPALQRAEPGRDWILSRILWLSGLEAGRNRLGDVDSMRRYIYLHGTPDHEAMGVPFSHGCIRMRNAEVCWLFDVVVPGTLVNLIT